MKRGTARLHPIMEAFIQSEPNSEFISQTSIQPKDELLVEITPYQKQIHYC